RWPCCSSSGSSSWALASSRALHASSGPGWRARAGRPWTCAGSSSASSAPDMDEQETLAEGTLVSHLIELRQCCIRALLALLIVFLGLVYFTDEIFRLVAAPLISVLPEGSQIQAIGITASFMTPLKTVAYVSLMIAMPYVLYQVWRFVGPALYRRERRFAVPLLVSSIALFYAGIAFAYFVVFRILFQFFFLAAPEFVVPN